MGARVFLASSGNVTDEIIAQYIEMQNEKPQNDSEDFQVGELWAAFSPPQRYWFQPIVIYFQNQMIRMVFI